MYTHTHMYMYMYMYRLSFLDKNAANPRREERHDNDG